MANDDRGLTIRKYQEGVKFIADPTTAPLLFGGASVNVDAFTDAKFGKAGERFIPAGTVVQMKDGLAVPYTGAASATPAGAAFATGTAYTEGQYVTNDGYTYIVTVAGTSGDTAPTKWGTKLGSKTSSGDVEFTAADAVGNNTDSPRPYVMASAVTEAAGSFFLTGSQETTGLYMAPTILIEDALPDADPKTKELPAAIRNALIAEGFKLTKSFYLTEVRTANP